MVTVNIHEAKTQLSRLVETAARGETVVIAKAGKPMAKLTAMDSPASAPSRVGFLEGLYKVPDDFDTMHASEIEKLFNGE